MPLLTFNRRKLNVVILLIHLVYLAMIGLFAWNADLLELVRISTIKNGSSLYFSMNLPWFVYMRVSGHLICAALCFSIGVKAIRYGASRLNEISRFFMTAIGAQIMLAGVLHAALLGSFLVGGWMHLLTIFMLAFETGSLTITSVIMYMYWDYIVAVGLRADGYLNEISSHSRK